ncbi:Suppressor of lurcher protein [Schistosoma japonicum]|nr:Suppressor of lurcher protein [Schistosoma japonicum]
MKNITNVMVFIMINQRTKHSEDKFYVAIEDKRSGLIKNRLHSVKRNEYVKIFDKLESNELNIHDIPSYELCGSFDELVQHHYISKKHILIMEARLSSTTGLLNLKYNGGKLQDQLQTI